MIEITDNFTIIQSDIDLVRKMNRSQKELVRPFDYWPLWAKADAQTIANYRGEIQFRAIR